MKVRQAARGVRLSVHARLRAEERGITPEEVADIVRDPDVRHPGSPSHGAGRLVHRRGDLAVVTGEESREGLLYVISVMRRPPDGEAT
jgi:hypothetical protein